MFEERADHFYVKILFNSDGEPIGHGASSNLDELTKPKDDKEKTEQYNRITSYSFESIMDEYHETMLSYYNFVPIAVSVSEIVVKTLASKRILNFSKNHGDHISSGEANKKQTFKIFKIPNHLQRQFSINSDDVVSASSGAKKLPSTMIIGIVSAYDAFLYKLLSHIFETIPEIIFSSEKQVSFSDLIKYNNIDEIKRNIIESEAESIVRESHHEQFSIMEKKFKIELRKDLPAWPVFVEICERRNLFTHTDGRVSDQYIKVCKSHGVDCSKIIKGQELKAPNSYFEKSVDTFHEVGLKLNYVLWRKLSPNQKDQADAAFNNLDMRFETWASIVSQATCIDTDVGSQARVLA